MTEKHCRFIIIFQIDNKLKQSQLWLPGLFISSWLLHLVGLPQNTSNSLACSAGIFLGWAKPCSCSWYCFSRHLWFYDSGRLGRVEIVTLTVGERLRCEGERRKGGRGRGEKFSSLSPLPPRSLWLAPSPPLIGKFQHGPFASKLGAKRKREASNSLIFSQLVCLARIKVTSHWPVNLWSSFDFTLLPSFQLGS